MNISAMTLEQVRTAGIQALCDKLGPVGLIRFLQQFDKGSGNYSKERQRKLANRKIDDLYLEIKSLRK